MPTLSIDNHLKGKYREREEDCKVFCEIGGINFNIVDRPLLLKDKRLPSQPKAGSRLISRRYRKERSDFVLFVIASLTAKAVRRGNLYLF
jgi:hypothetical protein